MASRASDLSPEHVLLGLLDPHPAHGYELHLRLGRDLGGLWHLSQSQVYGTLRRLEGRGWIAGTPQPQQHLPDRRLMRLTPNGRRRFRAWLHTPTASSVRAIRVEFPTRLYFASRLGPAVMLRLLDEQVRSVEQGLRQLDGARTSNADNAFADLALDLKLRQLASVLPWLDECRRRLIEAPETPSTSRRRSAEGHPNER
jgi:DNA-binding PadR family transcriptional regulator